MGRFLKKLLLALGAITILAAGAETWARKTYVHGRQATYDRALQLLEGWPKKDAFLRDREGVFGYHGSVFYDYYMAGPLPLESETVNHLADYYGARARPDSVEDPVQTVWFFGGSTMENLTTDDAGTIANQAIRYLNENEVPSRGFNFGYRSFHSTLESIKFQDLLRREPPERHPSLVVFYDGYNDADHAVSAGPGNIRKEFTYPIQLLVEHEPGNLFLYTLCHALSDNSMFFKRFIEPKIIPRPEYNKKRMKANMKNVSRAVEVYERNISMLTEICKAYDITPLFVLQPLAVLKQGLTPEEELALAEVLPDRPAFIRRYYAAAKERFADDPRFHDLSAILDNNGRWDFYDMGHTGPDSSIDIGRELGERLFAETRK